MPQEIFEVGDRVLMTPSKHLGTIVSVDIELRHNTPEAPTVRRYGVKLDGGGTLKGVYHGIGRAPHYVR